MLHKAVELKPDDGYIVDSLGWAYYRLGEFDKAATHSSSGRWRSSPAMR